MKQIGCALLLLLVGCASVRSTEDIPAVTGFSTRSFMGEWYEIARLPNVYETDLRDVTFTYTQVGTRIDLVKHGFREDRERMLMETGYPTGTGDVAEFRLNLLYDFGALHRVIWVSPEYDQAIVTGADRDSLWFLARTKTLPKADLKNLLKKAKDWGFDVSKLELPQQGKKK